MTKSDVSARIKQIKNLYEQALILTSYIQKQIGGSDLTYSKLVKDIPAEDIIKDLKKEGVKFDEEPTEIRNYPLLNITPQHPMYADLTLELENGDELGAYIAESDYGTFQTGSVYGIDGNTIDLSLNEIKKGELAKADGKDPDNRDIDIYTYEDPFFEDYTTKRTIQFEHIKEALNLEENNDERD